MMNDYVIHVTAEEYDLIVKTREERARQQAIEEQEQQISAAIAVAISVIGLAETKRIVRRAARDLRNIENSESL